MMNIEWKFRHKEELESNCQKLHALLKNGSSSWQVGWNKGISDIFDGTYTIRSSLERLNAINMLLKVAEVAFKERTYRIRIEAYVCWRHFISTVEKYGSNGEAKLLKMLLIPLSASNHSQIDVLRAKLQTWSTMVETPFIQEASICDNAASHLLKILYGPHALKTASTVPDLTEDCAVLFKKMWCKCEHTNANERLVEYVPLVITSLARDQRLYEIAAEIWCKVLDNVKANGWPDVHSRHLILTFKSLIESSYEHSHSLINRLLINLMEKHGGFSARLLNDFYVTEINEKTDLSGQKRKNIRSYWTTAIDSFSDQGLMKKVMATENLTWILMLPIEYLYDELDDIMVGKMRSFYETLCRTSNHADFTKLLMRNLTGLLHQSRASLSFLNATVRLCKIIALAPEKMKKKVSAATISGMRDVLLKINEKMKILPNRIVKDDESFVASYVACILLFMRECPQFEIDFVPLLREYNVQTNDDKYSTELPVAQLMNKYIGHKLVELSKNSKPKLRGSNDSVLSTMTSSSVAVITPKSRSASSLMLNLSSATKSPASQKCEDDNESVEFIAIKPKIKQSPMTEHQRETAKTKSHIPALYQDLSQSQSDSLIDSVSLLPNTVITSTFGTAVIRCNSTDFLEEDANLSPPNEKEKLEEIESETSDMIASTQPSNFNVSAFEKIAAIEESVFSLSSKEPVCPITANYANIENISIKSDNAEMSIDGSTTIHKSSVKRRSDRLLSKTSTECSQPKRKRRGRQQKSDESNSVEKIPPVSEQNCDEESKKKQKPDRKSKRLSSISVNNSKNETNEEMEMKKTQEPIENHPVSGEPINSSSKIEINPISSISIASDVANGKSASKESNTYSSIVPGMAEADSVLIVESNTPEVISIVDSQNQHPSFKAPQTKDSTKSSTLYNESKSESASESIIATSEEKTNKSFRKNEKEVSTLNTDDDRILRNQDSDSSLSKRNETSKKSFPSMSVVLPAYSNHRFRGIMMTKLAGNENNEDTRFKNTEKSFCSSNVCHSKSSNRPMSERTMNILTASVNSQEFLDESEKVRDNGDPSGKKMKFTDKFERVLMKSSSPAKKVSTATSKMINLIDRMTNTKTLQKEESYQSCTSDEASNDMIGDDEATSQDILYTPLQNCNDEIDAIVQKLNMQNVAIDLFHRMGIKSIGDLASMSTIAAKNIPAGDNRIRRLRDALKKYKEERRSNGLRTTSARVQNTDQSSSLVELLDEIERTSQNANQSSTTNETRPSSPSPSFTPVIVLKKLNVETKPTTVADCEQRSPSLEEPARSEGSVPQRESRLRDEQTSTLNIVDETNLQAILENDARNRTENVMIQEEESREKNKVTGTTVEVTTVTENENKSIEEGERVQLANEETNFISTVVRSIDEKTKSEVQSILAEVSLKNAYDVNATNQTDDNFSPEIIEMAEMTENHCQNQSVQKSDGETDLKYYRKLLGLKLQSIFWISASQLTEKRLALEKGENTSDNGVEDVVEMVIKFLKELVNSPERNCIFNLDQKRDLANLCKMIADKCTNDS